MTWPPAGDVPAARRVSWRDLPPEEPVAGVRRQTLDGERQSMVRYRYATGAVFPVHSHPEEQIALVVRGRLAFEVAGERHELGAGDLLVIPGGLPHGAQILGEEPAETINTLSPKRGNAP